MSGNTSHIEFDCGIAYERIRTWLNDELALNGASQVYTYLADDGCCLVEIHALEPRTFNRISLDRTSLVISGDERAVASFRKLFELRFVSAGG